MDSARRSRDVEYYISLHVCLIDAVRAMASSRVIIAIFRVVRSCAYSTVRFLSTIASEMAVFLALVTLDEPYMPID